MGRAQQQAATGSESGALLPDWRPLTPRSENWLREGAEMQGYPTTSAQFTAYREAGLLPDPDENGRYPEWALTSLIRIRALSESVRPISRRVVRLRGDYLFFPVPAAKLREAMIDVIPTIGQPHHKIARVATYGFSPRPSLGALANSSIQSRVLGTVSLDVGRRDRLPKLPHRTAWAEILDGIDLNRFDMWTPGWYAMVLTALPAFYAPAPNPLATFAPEEHLICYAVLDIVHRKPKSPTD